NMLKTARQREVVREMAMRRRGGRVWNMLAGQSPVLRSYLSKIKPDKSPMCEMCPGQVHNVEHAVLKCPKYDERRPEWLKDDYCTMSRASITKKRFGELWKFLEGILNIEEGSL
ncbi:hypothetical protein FOL47_000525, partial [Perkinsus chesapeaki]